MMSSEFEKARQNIKTLKNEPKNDVKLILYGLYKQATIGPCNKPKPSMTDFVGSAMWKSWNNLKKMPKKEAELKYIEHVNKLLEKENGPKKSNLSINQELQNSFKEIFVNEHLKDIKTSIVFGNVYKITFNRPEKLNAFSANMYQEIIFALNDAQTNKEVVICCVTGNGKYFSSGNDLQNYLRQDVDISEAFVKGIKLFEDFASAFIKFEKPLIALVNGPAVGASVTMLALFDLVIASNKATFAAPFTALALSPEACSSYTFPRLMGQLKANEILMFNKKLTAEEALERNLVNEIIKDTEFQEKVWKKIEGFSKLSVDSLILSKSIIRKNEIDNLLRVNSEEMKLLGERLMSGEFMNQVTRFVNKKSKL